MKACVRTHLSENDRKPSVSLFPSNSPKQEAADSLDVALSQNIVNNPLKREPNNVHEIDSEPDESADEDKDISEPAQKKIRKGENVEDVNSNNGSASVKKDVRRFSMENACKLCDEIFSSLDELIMHAKIEHNQRSKDNKKFSPEDIEYFLKVFTKMNKSHCPICRKAILNTLNWRGHLYTHCTVRKFVCKICGKSFTRGDHCKHHELRHKHGSPTVDEEEEEEQAEEEEEEEEEGEEEVDVE